MIPQAREPLCHRQIKRHNRQENPQNHALLLAHFATGPFKSCQPSPSVSW